MSGGGKRSGVRPAWSKLRCSLEVIRIGVSLTPSARPPGFLHSCAILPIGANPSREDGPLWQFACLALFVAVLSRCGGLRGRLARRRRRGPEGLRAAGGAQARNVPRKPTPVTGTAAPRIGQRILRAARTKIAG